jgi:DHA1 family multidrug resistance protein-like MFS transporter
LTGTPLTSPRILTTGHTKKAFDIFILHCYTWTVYCAGPIHATTSEGIVEYFGVSPVAVTLGLLLYILA